jgi:calcium-dependent protein kinase
MNKYTLQYKIGDGGYSTVYRCTDHLGIRYACKVLPISENKRFRVQQEIEMLLSLRGSTRVARLIDACEDNQSYYLIQEWCKGGALRDYMTNHDKYGENTVASIVRGVLRGLYHIHDKCIIHRDIKGPNVLFADNTEDAEIRIIDFGAAIYNTKRKNELIEAPDLVGTPWFMSPESLSHRFCDKSDIWSLGVLTYLLLCGKMPFNDRRNPLNPSTNAIFRSILTDSPITTGTNWDDISDEAKHFVNICLQKDYTKRPCAGKALKHPWLTSTDCLDRFTGEQLVCKPFQYEDNTIMKAQSIRYALEQKAK